MLSFDIITILPSKHVDLALAHTKLANVSLFTHRLKKISMSVHHIQGNQSTYIAYKHVGKSRPSGKIYPHIACMDTRFEHQINLLGLHDP